MENQQLLPQQDLLQPNDTVPPAADLPEDPQPGLTQEVPPAPVTQDPPKAEKPPRTPKKPFALLASVLALLFQVLVADLLGSRLYQLFIVGRILYTSADSNRLALIFAVFALCAVSCLLSFLALLNAFKKRKLAATPTAGASIAVAGVSLFLALFWLVRILWLDTVFTQFFLNLFGA